MTDKERKYRAEFRNVGKHLHKNEYLPINLTTHPIEFKPNLQAGPVLVNWGWAARNENGTAYIPFDDAGNPHPYEGFWEARCWGCPI